MKTLTNRSTLETEWLHKIMVGLERGSTGQIMQWHWIIMNDCAIGWFEEIRWWCAVITRLMSLNLEIIAIICEWFQKIIMVGLERGSTDKLYSDTDL